MTFLKQWWWLLVLGPLVAAFAAALFTEQASDTYKAESTILVTSGTGLEASERLTNTYAGLVTLRSVLTEVKTRLNLNLSEQELARKITVSSDFSNQLIRISAKDAAPLLSTQIANTAAMVFVDRTNHQLLQLTQPAVEPAPGSPPSAPAPAKLLVVEEAVPTAESAKPSLLINAGLAAALGLLIAGSIGVALDALGGSLRAEEA
ncbi:MAG TPA: hypothetical protein VJB57_14950 [Dehalococcoidia bacterium]|nr:hypothetical protein [Dehalococcoidia bacterium]